MSIGDTRKVVFEPIVHGWLAHRTYQAGDTYERTATYHGTLPELVGDLFSIRGDEEAQKTIRELIRRNEELDFFPFKAFFWGFLIGLGIGLFSMWVHFS